MASGGAIWRRWMRVAHRAAEIQAHVLFAVLYVLAIVPMGWLGLGRADDMKRPPDGERPEWRKREPRDVDLAASRRQF
jgi:hypothetical protein